MSLFNFNQQEMLTFFAVLVRYGVLVAVLPFLGDRFIPAPAKVLLALAMTIALFPALVAAGDVKPGEAILWGATAGGIVGTIALEALFGLVLGYTAKLLFDGIMFGAHLTGTFMGFASASIYDPHQETQTQVVAEVQLALAMLIFLALDGHHLMLRASLDSYHIVGLGKVTFGAAFGQRLLEMTGQVFKFAVQLSAPISIALFGVNVAFGVLAKAIPQVNILVLSFAVTTLIGLFVMMISLPEFQSVVGNILGRMGEWLESMEVALHG